MNFKIDIDDLELLWKFVDAEVYNNAFHTKIVKQFGFNLWARHKTDPTEPHTGHSGVVVLPETKDRIPDFIEFDDLTEEDVIRWTKRNTDMKALYDLILDQMKHVMVFSHVKFKFNNDSEKSND